MPITRQEFEQKDCSEGRGGWMVSELRRICIDLGLTVTGNKTAMCNRIKAYFDRVSNSIPSSVVPDNIRSRPRSATRSADTTENTSNTASFFNDLLRPNSTAESLIQRILARQRNSQVDTLTDSVQSMGLNEEDETDFTDTISNSESIVHELSSPEHCVNDNIISLEPYAEDDQPIIIYTLNSQGKYEKAVCMTIEELTESMKADLNVFPPSNFMTIYTTPRDAHTAGYGGKPTGKLVFKLPVNNILITFGSLQMILSNKETKEFYMQPLYDGKRRRVGNLKGLFGPSMNHGQVPGFVINKLFTKNEIKLKTVVKETSGDYPMFLCDNMTPLIDLGIDVTSLFTRNLIKSLLQL
jgi:hypothetical protein